MSIIKTENLCFSYDEGREVLKNINIEINEGEFVAVLGHNGSGKSTFAKHLNAILLPTSGKVFVDGMDTSDEEKLGDIRTGGAAVAHNKLIKLMKIIPAHSAVRHCAVDQICP